MKIYYFLSRGTAVGLMLLAAAGVRGQGVWYYPGPIYSFGSGANNSDGTSPQGGVVVSPDGKTLYGTTHSGGKHNQGTVFAFPLPSGPPITLWDFGNQFGTTDGNGPEGNLVLANGILYGTTDYGGPHNRGVVYCIGADGQNPPYRWLYNFSGSIDTGGTGDGDGPVGGLILSSDGTIL
jgi:uncharacterized repeat protein (TIGR03803 family)